MVTCQLHVFVAEPGREGCVMRVCEGGRGLRVDTGSLGTKGVALEDRVPWTFSLTLFFRAIATVCWFQVLHD